MAHALYRATLALHTPLGSPLAGDTLFGQLCWALREAWGEAELTRRLEGYTAGRPWLVVSDGFPANYLPKPTLPQHFDPQSDPAARKAAKKKHWIPKVRTNETLSVLLASGVDDATAYGIAPLSAIQPHNTLNRLTGTTGEAPFAPYALPLTFHAPGQRIDLYLVLEEDRVSCEEVSGMLAAIGASGFGRDASTGLGKFTLEKIELTTFAEHAEPNAYWTLAPCAPQGQGFDGAESYWRVVTRFGRHGNAYALASNPFKTPVLLASTAAVFVPTDEFAPRLFIGQGLGGSGQLSKVELGTVQQGYAPVVPITINKRSA